MEKFNKGLLYPKSGKTSTLQALQTKKQQTIDLEAVPLKSNQKSSEEFRIAGSFPKPCCKTYKQIFPL